MNEYEILFVGNSGVLYIGYFYGGNETEAKSNAMKMGISRDKIKSVRFNESYRGYGHI